MNYNTMNTSKPVIIGIDRGYGNIKTAYTCFKTGVTAYDRDPAFQSDLLIYEGRYYIIGDGHKEFARAAVFPQGFSAVGDHLREFCGVNMLEKDYYVVLVLKELAMKQQAGLPACFKENVKTY